MALRIYRETVEDAQLVAGQRIERAQLIDFVAPELDTEPNIFVCRMDLDRVSAHPKRSALEIEIIPLVENLDQLGEDVAPQNPLALFEHEQHAVIRFRRTKP